MPLIHVTTSAAHPVPADTQALLAGLSRTLSAHFKKPEKWVMTALAPPAAMTFGASSAPACYVEVKNIGELQPADSEALSAVLCDQLAQGLGVERNRIYIEFTDARSHLWGWNGGTFG